MPLYSADVHLISRVCLPRTLWPPNGRLGKVGAISTSSPTRTITVIVTDVVPWLMSTTWRVNLYIPSTTCISVLDVSRLSSHGAQRTAVYFDQQLLTWLSPSSRPIHLTSNWTDRKDTTTLICSPSPSIKPYYPFHSLTLTKPVCPRSRVPWWLQTPRDNPRWQPQPMSHFTRTERRAADVNSE